jgi:hypothetical protein
VGEAGRGEVALAGWFGAHCRAVLPSREPHGAPTLRPPGPLAALAAAAAAVVVFSATCTVVAYMYSSALKAFRIRPGPSTCDPPPLTGNEGAVATWRSSSPTTLFSISISFCFAEPGKMVQYLHGRC